MEVLKVYLVLCVFATALACDLKETQAEIDAKDAAEAYIAEHRANVIANTRYRLHYHVAPPVGWMNDPNGFSFFKGNYHLFYQFYPFDVETGNVGWGHVVSEDLVEWTQQRIALLAEKERCFSGSAIEKDGTLVLMYTADIRITADTSDESQYLAFSNDGVVFNKYILNPVISNTPDSSVNFRDPKVWKYENNWYVVIGSRTADDKGRVLFYKSSDMGTWEYLNAVNETNDEQLGYMWECPDFFELNGSYVLLMSPQGMTSNSDRYQNQYQTGYIIGSFEYENGTFKQEVPFQEIDYGHDFYATQTMEKDGKRYLIAWMGSWDGAFTERADGWAGAMTIIRELILHENRILMKPVANITKLRGLAVHTGPLPKNESISALNQTGELNVSFNLSQDLNMTIQGKNDEKLIILSWNATAKKVALDRNGVIRQGEWTPVLSESWRVFLDASSIEVFCGEGEVVFSSRVYPNGTWLVTNTGSQDFNVTAYPLNRSVPL